MHLTGEQISEIEQMAELFFSPEEIAVNIEVDPDLLSDEIYSGSGEAFQAYTRGWMKGEIPLRKSIVQAANNGSNPAQQMLLNIKHRTEIKRP